MASPSRRTTRRRTRPLVTRPPVIVVAGDVTIDWLAQSNVDWLSLGRAAGAGPPADSGPAPLQNWQVHRGIRMEARPGGALLLARAIALAVHEFAPRPVIRTYRVPDLRRVPPERVLHSVVELESWAVREGGGPAPLRVKRFHGYSGPAAGGLEPLRLADDDVDARLVVLDDAGNGFRHRPESWPRALSAPGKRPIVIMKAAPPLFNGPLFERVLAGHRDRLIVVLNADDLRAEGVDISRQLSWERSAREFLWQVRHNPDLEPLRSLPHAVVRFDLDGAIHCTGAGRTAAARLVYDPALPEGGFRERWPGGMVGLTDVFLAALISRMMRNGVAGMVEGVRDGLRSARRWHRRGIGPGTLDYGGSEVFGPPEPVDGVMADAEIPPSSRRDSADPDFWSLLHEFRGAGLERMARQLVVDGETETLRTVPVGEFGALRTVDRAEIESFRGIRNLIGEYLHRPAKRPLSIAVFGPPGSGKSFGVEQVAESVSRLSEARIAKVEFNLSQFGSGRDLVAALHRVRDEVLRGRVPLVFFDEFDSPLDGPLGWLRSFLAPMQDGVFRDGEAMHPIGRAIFVFAGGLSPTLARFTREVFDPEVTPEERASERTRFREAKGPDFVSRLRGYVNVLGPNPDATRPEDHLYLIRRATILRSLLLRNFPGLADPENPRRLRIDEGVLRALVGVPVYRHGVRSMEAVLDMSRLDARDRFDPSALPPPDQLDQHVSAEAFSRLVLQGVLFAAAREAIAEAIHERYRQRRGKGKGLRDPARTPWVDLDEEYRNSNRAQAEDILRKLELVGCGYRPRTGRRTAAFGFTSAEIERLAELEHVRFTEERLRQGWTHGPARSLARKTSPYLVPWGRLAEPARQIDRDAVAAIPEILAQAGFEVYRQ